MSPKQTKPTFCDCANWLDMKSQRDELQSRVKELEAERDTFLHDKRQANIKLDQANEKLKLATGALEFYADERELSQQNLFRGDCDEVIEGSETGWGLYTRHIFGKRAREALRRIKGEK